MLLNLQFGSFVRDVHSGAPGATRHHQNEHEKGAGGEALRDFEEEGGAPSDGGECEENY